MPKNLPKQHPCDTLRKIGFLTCQQKNDTLYPGPLFQITKIYVNEKVYKVRYPYHPQTLPSLLKAILDEWANEGFWFAQLHLKNIVFEPMQKGIIPVQLYYHLDKGKVVYLQDLTIQCKRKYYKPFLQALIQMRSGSIFRKEQLESLHRILNRTPYYHLRKVSYGFFSDSTAWVQLHLEPKRSNRFDGFIALIPPQQQGQTLQFTAQLHLTLINSFGIGERLSLVFNRFLTQSQALQLELDFPYVSGTPLGLGAQFRLHKQDTTFVRQFFAPYLSYQVSPSVQLKLLYRSGRSILLNPRPYRLVRWPPPPVIDSRNKEIGLGIEVNNTDLPYSPTKGIIFENQFFNGNKEIFKNPGLDSLEYERFPVPFRRRQLQWRLEGYYTLGRFHTFRLATLGFWLQQPLYFDSDMAFVGGLHSLRGFTDNQFLLQQYVIVQADYRIRLERQSYLGPFTDWGFLWYREDFFRTFSLGLELALLLKRGFLRFAYAMGSFYPIQLQPLRARIHIAFESRF